MLMYSTRHADDSSADYEDEYAGLVGRQCAFLHSDTGRALESIASVVAVYADGTTAGALSMVVITRNLEYEDAKAICHTLVPYLCGTRVVALQFVDVHEHLT